MTFLEKIDKKIPDDLRGWKGAGLIFAISTFLTLGLSLDYQNKINKLEELKKTVWVEGKKIKKELDEKIDNLKNKRGFAEITTTFLPTILAGMFLWYVPERKEEEKK